jgi:hypothetical protein
MIKSQGITRNSLLVSTSLPLKKLQGNSGGGT